MKGPSPIRNDAMRDKVDHMREEVNVVSRRCDKFGIEVVMLTTLEHLPRKENRCSVSNQHDAT
jgi:hypothetical protein